MGHPDCFSMKIRLSTVEKDMITATQGKMSVLDADSTAA